MAGILGLPFPNGLIPQAPFHTESLCVTKVIHDDEDDHEGDDGDGDNDNDNDNDNEGGDRKGHWEVRRTHVVEQRVSNLAQGLLTLGTMTGPLLVVLHLIPQGVLAGLFFIMGYQALEGNGVTLKLLFLLRDRRAAASRGDPLCQIRRRARLWAFVAIEIVGFGATFAITQTVAAVGFPVFILALIPVRALLLPRWFSPEELALLDAPTASPFTMENVGGSYGGGGGAEVPEVVALGAVRSGDGEWEGDETTRSAGLFAGGGSGHLSGGSGGRGDIGLEQELAELGESKTVRLSTPASGPRSRNGAVAKDEEGSGVSRRHIGKAQER